MEELADAAALVLHADTPAPSGASTAPAAAHKRKAAAPLQGRRAKRHTGRPKKQATRETSHRRRSAGDAAPIHVPQSGKLDPWQGIQYVGDEIKPADSAVRRALQKGPAHLEDAGESAHLVCGTSFEPSSTVLEVAWQGDRVGWGVRWCGAHVLGANSAVGIFAGAVIGKEGPLTPQEADWDFDTLCADAKGRHLWIDLQHSGNALRFANHSCNPNCVARFAQVKGLWIPALFVRAKHVLRRGDWITFRYSHSTTIDPTIPNRRCYCGVPECTRWFFPPTEEEKAQLRLKKRDKLARKIAALDEQRAQLVARLADQKTPPEVVLSSGERRSLKPIGRRGRKNADAVKIKDSFCVVGTISHGGVTYHRAANAAALGKFGMVWFLWPTPDRTGVPIAVMKVALPQTIDNENALWKRIADSGLLQRAPFFPKYLGQVNRGHCTPRLKGNVSALILSYGGHTIHSLAKDAKLVSALTPHNIKAVAFQLVWAIIGLHTIARLQHCDLHGDNITYSIKPALVTAWSRMNVWQFDSLLVINIIDIGCSEQVQPSNQTAFIDMSRALGALRKACNKMGADTKELTRFVKLLRDNKIRSLDAINNEYFADFRSCKPVAELLASQGLTGEGSTGMVLHQTENRVTAAAAPLGALERCTVCMWFDRKPGKLYCSTPACKAKIKKN